MENRFPKNYKYKFGYGVDEAFIVVLIGSGVLGFLGWWKLFELIGAFL